MELERSVAAHPQELAELDLFDTWRLAELPAEHFDPFVFHHRMATYRLLIDTTNRRGLFGPDNRTNPLWGLMFQHQWQFRTGRLGADSQRTGRIDPDAPWGYGNYTLCVIPWMGAVEAGTVEPLALTGPLRPSRFAYPTGDFAELVLPAGFHRGVADWKAYFSLVESARPGDDVEPLRMALWKAHKTCLDLVVAHLYHIDAEPYSDTELRFLRGWCRMVDYLWVAAWPTDFDFMCEQGLDVLPERLLVGPADFTTGSDLPPEMRRTLRGIIELGESPSWRYQLNLTLWKRVMRTRAAREDVVNLLAAVFDPQRTSRLKVVELLVHLLRP